MANHGLTLFEFLKRRHTSIALLVVIAFVAWGVTCWTLLRQFGGLAPVSGGDIATAVMTSLAFLIAWYYADLTAGILDATQAQFAHGARPCVVLEWRGVGPTGWTFFVRNVGTGVAVNVVLCVCGTIQNAAKFMVLPISALGAGGEQELEPRLVQALNFNAASQPGTEPMRVRLWAQPLVGREWAISDSTINASLRFGHRVNFTVPTPEQFNILTDGPFEGLDPNRQKAVWEALSR